MLDSMLDSVAKAFQDGGEFMYFITLTSAFASAIVIERVWVLMIRYRADTERIMQIVDKAVASGQGDPQAIAELERWNTTPLGRLAITVLARIGSGSRAVRDRLFETYLAVVPDIKRRTDTLSMVANVATLLGLLGTIIGLIDAFAGVAAADPAKKQALLASGIAVAMNTTAYGLMVAIPCIVSHSILSARYRRILEDVETLRHRVTSALSRDTDSGAVA